MICFDRNGCDERGCVLDREKIWYMVCVIVSISHLGMLHCRWYVMYSSAVWSCRHVRYHIICDRMGPLFDICDVTYVIITSYASGCNILHLMCVLYRLRDDPYMVMGICSHRPMCQLPGMHSCTKRAIQQQTYFDCVSDKCVYIRIWYVYVNTRMLGQ